MNREKFFWVILVATITASLFTINLEAEAEEIKLAGGATVETTIINPIKPYFEETTGHKIRFLKVGSKNAFFELLRGNVNASTADVSFDELIALAKKEGMDVGDISAYRYFVIGKDRLVFFIHKDNPVSKLSREQLKGIFTGKITNWKEVGGKDAPIIVVIGNLSTGTNSLVSKFILDGEKFTKDVLEVNTADDVKSNVALNLESIGFGPIKLKDDSVKVPDTPDIGRELILVTKGKPSASVQKLIDFITGEGQKYIKN